MNLILLDVSQQLGDNVYALTERQQLHITKVIKAASGDSLRVGLINGKIGEGIYETSTDTRPSCIHSITLLSDAPEPLPLILVMALPRPNVVKRTLQNIAAMGVKDIYFIHSSKVEKSYWQSPVLQEEAIQQYLLEGLEQAKDTIMPKYTLVPRFRPFVEDILPALLKGRKGLLAHPYMAKNCPIDLQEPALLALGPEGGWNEFEVVKWLDAGMEAIQLGERVLKVETVVPVLLSRLYPL